MDRSCRTFCGHTPLENQKAFTLIELLVVVAIMTLLMAILMPSLGQARRAAVAVKCASQMRQSYIAIETYCQEFNNVYPRPTGNTSFSYPYFTFLGKLGMLDLQTANRIATCPAEEKIASWYQDVSIGMNYTLGQRWGVPIYVKRQQILKPDQYAELADSLPNWTANSGPQFFGRDQMVYRHNFKANVLYADGHAGTVVASEIPIIYTTEFNNSPFFFFDK